MVSSEPVFPDRQMEVSATVLCVDDDPQFLEAVRVALERESSIERVLIESDPENVCDRLAAVDCVVSDNEMPGTTGIDLLKRIRREHANLPFILFTATGSEDVANRAITAGVTDYVEKGTSAEQFSLLARRIENAVVQRRVEKEVHRGFEAIETAREGIGLLDAERTFIYVNQAYADIYDYSQTELLGMDWSVLDPQGITETITGEVLPVVEEEGEWSGELVGQRKDGSTFPEHFTLSETGSGELVNVVRDMTERKQRERELRRRNERLDGFAGMIAHDLRNPLSVAHVHLQAARENGDERNFAELERALERMDDITTDVLEMVRSESVAETSPTSLAATARRAWGNVDTADATLSVSVDPETEAAADAGRLLELFVNLFRNAVTHAGDAVSVRVGRLPDGFYVGDDGPGIPEDERELVLTSGYSNAENGTGLGLSIVSQIVDAHDWRLAVRDGADGGARFEVTGVSFD